MAEGQPPCFLWEFIPTVQPSPILPYPMGQCLVPRSMIDVHVFSRTPQLNGSFGVETGFLSSV